MTSKTRESAVRTPVGVAIIIPRPGLPSLELPPHIDVRTGVTLQEVLQTLEPLASSLEVLNLSGNELGGAITADVAVFNKLKKLELSDMNLNGGPLSIRSERFIIRVDVFPFWQDNCPRNSANL